MQLILNFENIIDAPRCAVRVCDQALYEGSVEPQLIFDLSMVSDRGTLTISHIDKLPQDTLMENGRIVRDRSFELASIVIDGYDLEELKWNSRFTAVDGAVYESCLFFGPNGDFKIEFELPILKWILKCRHQNDPCQVWEQDYNYYMQACQILQQISKK